VVSEAYFSWPTIIKGAYLMYPIAKWQISNTRSLHHHQTNFYYVEKYPTTEELNILYHQNCHRKTFLLMLQQTSLPQRKGKQKK